MYVITGLILVFIFYQPSLSSFGTRGRGVLLEQQPFKLFISWVFFDCVVNKNSEFIYLAKVVFSYFLFCLTITTINTNGSKLPYLRSSNLKIFGIYLTKIVKQLITLTLELTIGSS